MVLTSQPIHQTRDINTKVSGHVERQIFGGKSRMTHSYTTTSTRCPSLPRTYSHLAPTRSQLSVLPRAYSHSHSFQLLIDGGQARLQLLVIVKCDPCKEDKNMQRFHPARKKKKTRV